jgi:hypothetical protein
MRAGVSCLEFDDSYLVVRDTRARDSYLMYSLTSILYHWDLSIPVLRLPAYFHDMVLLLNADDLRLPESPGIPSRAHS